MPISEKRTPIGDVNDAVEWLKGRLVRGVPRHQAKGPIPFRNPRTYVPCPFCTQMAVAADKDYAGTVGTSKQHQRQHLKDHRAGKIRRPTMASA